MKFLDVAQVFEQIEQESSRTEITKLLANILQQASAQEAQIISYLSSGSLFPPYKTLQFNIAKKGVIEILAILLSKSSQEIKDLLKELGDLGSVVGQEWQGGDQGLSVQDLYDELVACAYISGTGSTRAKHNALLVLLQKVDAFCAKYIVRIITGTLRLGFSDMTLIDALSWMQVGDKSIRKNLEHTYNICADIGLVAYTLKEKGEQGIDDMNIQVGIPIRPAAAERLNSAQAIVDKLGHCVAQPKLDGFRIQVHAVQDGDKITTQFYSRNLLDMSEMFPDLKQSVETLLRKHASISSLICEGEAIVYDEDIGLFLPFQETVKRKRKHGVEQASQDLPLRLYLFDVLYFNGVSMLDKTHADRRQVLENLLSQADDNALYAIEEKKITTGQQLHEYFLQNLHAGLEGLVVKREDALYQPGKRNFNWIKLKRHARGKLTDTIDCVILGYYHGAGKRTHFGVGAFLVGVYNDTLDRFESVAKVGTGMKDDEWKDLKKRCTELELHEQPHNVRVAKDLYPDVWMTASIVCVIQCEEITQSPVHTAGKTDEQLGLALRFPRFISYRSDKSAQDATTVKELQSLHKGQKVDSAKV